MNDLTKHPEQGRRLIYRHGDIMARRILIDLAESSYEHGDAERCRASASLIHADEYLKDRLSYELHPWPKGCVKIEL